MRTSRFAESGAGRAPGQNQMSIDPVPPRTQLRERHPNLKCDSSLLWKDDDGAKAAEHARELIVDRPDPRRLAVKVMCQGPQSARMRLIAVRELTIALWTMPKRLF